MADETSKLQEVREEERERERRWFLPLEYKRLSERL